MNLVPVPVDVDPESGEWSSEGQPMILIPRRFFVFIQMESERRFGLDATQHLYDEATRKGARVWCEQEEKRSGAAGETVFERYLDRVSSRGMGRFEVQRLAVGEGYARVVLKHSIFVSEYGAHAGRNVCYSFAAALAGAIEYLRERAGFGDEPIAAREVGCESNEGEQCAFEVSMASTASNVRAIKT
ncbi:MAG: DUF5943 domain-containing protein [Pseudomonadota bacterium]|nr:DUF5943 domain-containing protein [Pseudomonadota bacterium]